MELLPDLALLAVFSRLDTGQLLRARGVCRRWRDLALCPLLWEGRAVSFDDPFVEAVLQLAPCLEILDVESYWNAHLKDLPAATTTTGCAARELRLWVRDLWVRDRPSLLWAHQVLDNQVTLGRLRALSLTFAIRNNVRSVRTLMSLVDWAGLEELSIRVGNRLPSLDLVRDKSQPGATTLRRLRWKSYVNRHEPLLKSLLEAHEDTLEVVEVDMPLFMQEPGRQIMAQLSRCPRLRQLRVPLCPELAALNPGCLTRLQIDLPCGRGLSDEDVEEMTARLAPVFRSATRLEELIIEDSYSLTVIELSWVIVFELVRALASYGCSALRELRCRMRYFRESMAEKLWSVLRAAPLPRLPRLRTLELPCVPPPGLLAPDCVPDLRLLILSRQLCSQESCALPQVWELLAARPRLHVKAQAAYSHGCTESCAACCVQTGHSQPGRGLASAFYSHPEGEPCDLHSGGLWLRLQ